MQIFPFRDKFNVALRVVIKRMAGTVRWGRRGKALQRKTHRESFLFEKREFCLQQNTSQTQN